MGGSLSIMIGFLGFTTLIIAPFITNRIIKYKLEIARINAETTIKAEEIRSRNQLEFEKFLKQEENVDINNGLTDDGSNKSNRNRVRE